MAFTAADVKKLREMTNVGMMDCKKALTETDGDMDKAVEYLREKGLAKAAKKAGRIAAEGVSYALVENGVGALVEVNCETDFCAKSAPFVAFVKDIAKVVADNDPADVDALMNCKYPGTELTVSETMPEKVMSIGENLQIRRFVRFAENTSVGYVHAGGKIGVLVNLAVEGGVDATEIGKNVKRPVVGMHFFNPADRMKLIEVIAGCNTPAETVEKIKEISVAIGKSPVQVNEAAGFVVNRILIPMINEAAFIKMEGVSDIAGIDTAMKLGANHPMGPLELGDFIGLDICLAIMDVLYHETGDSKYRACPLIRKMVRGGNLGCKTGKGFYVYNADRTKTPVDQL